MLLKLLALIALSPFAIWAVICFFFFWCYLWAELIDFAKDCVNH